MGELLAGSCREAAQGRESLAEIQTLLATFLQRREGGTEAVLGKAREEPRGRMVVGGV